MKKEPYIFEDETKTIFLRILSHTILLYTILGIMKPWMS